MSCTAAVCLRAESARSLHEVFVIMQLTCMWYSDKQRSDARREHLMHSTVCSRGFAHLELFMWRIA